MPLDGNDLQNALPDRADGVDTRFVGGNGLSCAVLRVDGTKARDVVARSGMPLALE